MACTWPCNIMPPAFSVCWPCVIANTCEKLTHLKKSMACGTDVYSIMHHVVQPLQPLTAHTNSSASCVRGAGPGFGEIAALLTWQRPSSRARSWPERQRGPERRTACRAQAAAAGQQPEQQQAACTDFHPIMPNGWSNTQYDVFSFAQHASCTMPPQLLMLLRQHASASFYTVAPFRFPSILEWTPCQAAANTTHDSNPPIQAP